MNILIIGTKESLDKSKNIIADFNIKTQEIVIDDTTLISKRIKEIPTSIDGIFATGIGVYYELYKNFDLKVPINYAHRGVVSLSKAFFSYLKSKKKFKRPAFDVIDKYIVDDLIEEYGLNFENYYVLKNKPKYDESFYLSSFIRLFKEGKIDCVFTAFGYCYEILKKLEIPVFRLNISSFDIKRDVHNLISQIKNQDAMYKTFLIHNFKGEDSDLNQRIIEEYNKLVDGVLFDQDGDRIVISNKGYDKEDMFKNISSFLRNNDTDLGLSLATGESINKAIENSQKAKKILDENYRICYFDGEAIEKYDIGKNTRVGFSFDLEKISNESEILAKHIFKIASLVASKKDPIFTSKDLASDLNLTRRSANRIMDKLVKSGYARKLKANGQSSGRPQKRIEILF